jgi:hypothetical protein
MKYRETQKQEQPKPQKPQGSRLWLVEISLTSGKSIQFYVKAKTQFDAYEKADGYMCWLGDNKLSECLKVFRLRP